MILRTPNFPKLHRHHTTKKHLVYLGIGGNIGDVKRRFELLIHTLKSDSKLQILKTSIIFKNPPFGFLDQPDFYNAMVVAGSDYSPSKLLRQILYLEKKFGRIRKFKNSPRTLDIDIIFFDDLHIKSKNLDIPHPEWSKRDSVLVPLTMLNKVKR